MSGLELKPHQVTARDFLRARKQAILAADAGLGKTPTTIMALPDQGRVMVVCPATLTTNWRNEILRWRPELLERTDIVSAGKIPELPKGERLAALVLDEAHAYKTAQSKRTKAVRALAKQADRAWLLTATPVVANPKDLWALLQLFQVRHSDGTGSFGRPIGLGSALYGNFEKYAKLNGGTEFLGRWTWSTSKIKPGAMEPIRKHGLILRQEKSVLEEALPPKTVRILDVGRYPWVSEDPGETMSARKSLAEAKIPALLAAIREHQRLHPEEPVVVFSCHDAPLDAIHAHFGAPIVNGKVTVKRRAKIVEDFQNGGVMVLGVGVRAGGVGITLTRACYGIFVDAEWTPALNSQAEDRLHRIGQEWPVFFTYLVAEHRLDKRLRKLLEVKGAIIERLIGGLR